MNFADIVSELVFHLHVPLAAIAGLSDAQVRWIYFRDRDKYGSLKGRRRRSFIRKVPPSKRVSFDVMYKNRLLSRGFTEEQVNERWRNYVRENPSIMGILTSSPFEDELPPSSIVVPSGPKLVRKRTF